jgi:MurNAc alpha-1-phosphate uridylyltransferase
MDALLLMQRTASAVGYEGIGDYVIDPVGVPRRRREREVAPFLFAGVQILHRRLFEGAPQGKFSLNLLYDKAEKAKRLHAIVHDGEWYHVGTPEALGVAERLLALGRIEF